MFARNATIDYQNEHAERAEEKGGKKIYSASVSSTLRKKIDICKFSAEKIVFA